MMAEESILIVKECDGGSIHLPAEVLRKAGFVKDIYVNTLLAASKSDGSDGGKPVITMRVEDIIKHLKETYLEG
jgi:hypothetical protein